MRIKHIIREENFLSLAGNLLTALFGIATFAIMARSRNTDEFGQWVLFVTGGSFIEMFRFGITNTGVIRYLSGTEKKDRNPLIASNALIAVISTTVIVSMLLLCRLAASNAINQTGYRLFFQWYPILAFINLPWNNALVILQADRKYRHILFLKAFNSCAFFLIVIADYIFLNLSLEQIVISLLIVNSLTSLISLYAGWDGIRMIKKATRHYIKQIVDFGKYTTFTLIGTNLLRSTDTLIISLSPLGNGAVALYSIPLKLTELQQIPLRSFTATAFPKMSKASLENNMDAVKNYFYSYTGALTYLFTAASLGTFLFADVFVELLAGRQYLGVDPLTGTSVTLIVKVLSIYGLLLPLDRMTGICLDSINKPAVNAVKVFCMVITNVIGDLVAVFVFKSLILVAVASILFTVAGIFLGMYFLDKELHITYKAVMIHGNIFYRTIFRRGVTNNTIMINA